MKNIRNNLTWILTVIWFCLVLYIAISLSGCSKPNNKIEPGDIVEKCTIVSVKAVSSRSTIEPDPYYHYQTDCGKRIVTKRNTYKIGDTITYVYKQIK